MNWFYGTLYKNGYKNPRKGIKETEEQILIKVLNMSKPVIQYDKTDKIIKEWNSAKEASKEGFTPSLICKCCKHQHKTHKNYIWKYKI